MILLKHMKNVKEMKPAWKERWKGSKITMNFTEPRYENRSVWSNERIIIKSTNEFYKLLNMSEKLRHRLKTGI